MNDVKILLDAVRELKFNMHQSQIALKIRIHELEEAIKRLEKVYDNEKSEKESQVPRTAPQEQGQTDSVQE